MFQIITNYRMAMTFPDWNNDADTNHDKLGREEDVEDLVTNIQDIITAPRNGNRERLA